MLELCEPGADPADQLAVDRDRAQLEQRRQITVYFTSDRSGGPQIYRVASKGGSPDRVTFEGNYNARPRISPDGSKIAVVHNDRGNYRIAVVDVARSYTQVLTEGSR